MLKFLRQYSTFLTLSVIMHVVIFTFLLLSMSSTPQLPKPPGASEKKNVIQAVTVDASKVQAELKKLERAENQRKKQEDDRQKRLREEADKAQQQRKEEQKKLALLKEKQQKQEEEIKQQKLAQERKIKELQQKQAQEKAQIAKLKQAAVELEKKKKVEEQRQKVLQEKRKKELAEKKAAKKQAEKKAAEAKAAAAKKIQQQKLRESQARREKALKEQIAAEEAAEQERELLGVRSQYIDNIAAVVRGNWRRPSNVDKDVSCLIVVTQIPGGEIISYKVSKCTGDKAFQYSVERAVSKTSHLPTPPDPRVFDRVIRFTFTGK